MIVRSVSIAGAAATLVAVLPAAAPPLEASHRSIPGGFVVERFKPYVESGRAGRRGRR